MTKSRASLASGGTLLGVAKLYFLVASYATVLALTRLLDPATFGSYSAVGRLIAVPNMVIIYTLMFSVSRPLAAEFGSGSPNYDAIRARGFRMALVLGGIVSTVFFAGASIFADALSEPELTLPIRVVAPISVLYAVYAVNVGTINARRLFARQAALDMIMASTKAALLIAFAALGFGLARTLGGFTAASLIALTISTLLVRAARPEGATGTKSGAPPIHGLAATLIIFTTATNLLLSVDLFVLKHFAVDDAAKDAVGYYSGAQYVAQVPYSLLNAISLLMFPLIASLHADGDEATARRYISQATKVTVLLLALMASVAATASDGIMHLLFPPAYASSADELRRIVIGYSGYSLAVTAAWILNSSDRSRTALLLVCIGLVGSAGGGFLSAPKVGPGGVAWSVMGAGIAAAVAALFALHHHFRAGLQLAWVAKVGAAVGLVVLVGSQWSPSSKLMILVQLALLASCFLAVCFGTKAVTLAEIRELRKRG